MWCNCKFCFIWRFPFTYNNTFTGIYCFLSEWLIFIALTSGATKDFLATNILHVLFLVGLSVCQFERNIFWKSNAGPWKWCVGIEVHSAIDHCPHKSNKPVQTAVLNWKLITVHCIKLTMGRAPFPKTNFKSNQSSCLGHSESSGAQGNIRSQVSHDLYQCFD